LIWVRAKLFNNFHNTLFTAAILIALALLIPTVVHWALIDAVWYTHDPTDCRRAAGAFWAVVAEKYRLMLFGTFPYAEQWRGFIDIAIIIGLAIISTFRRLWSKGLVLAWMMATVAVLILMLGGVFGLRPTGTHLWGGLPFTLIMSLITVVAGLPTAILLPLGRCSQLPAIKTLCVGIIELIRGLPLLVVLFMAAVMLPLFLPPQLTINKFVAAQVAMIIFFGAYAAEDVRGGMQAIPRGQYEAADAIGVSYWQKMRRIILPQALRIVIPALVNDIIRTFKNTTFVSILGMYDVLGGTNAALQDPQWVRFTPEAYLFVFALYFLFCFSMSKYSQRVERDLSKGRNY
jgi:general L-amino acid transport system permease protein